MDNEIRFILLLKVYYNTPLFGLYEIFNNYGAPVAGIPVDVGANPKRPVDVVVVGC